MKRSERNKDLVERMKRGESLSTVDAAATFWPPRPIIKKDPTALEAIHGKVDESGQKGTDDDARRARRRNSKLKTVG